MKELVFACTLVLLAAEVTTGQSLGELAKEEKERRKNAEKNGPVRVITDEDLGTGAPEPEGEPAEFDSTLPETESPSRGEAPATSSRERLASDPWNEVFAGFREAYYEASQGLEFMQGFQRHCDEGTDPPPLPALPGGYWMVNCERVPLAIERLRDEMKQIQEDCFDRARRMGVPPGRARLN